MHTGRVEAAPMAAMREGIHPGTRGNHVLDVPVDGGEQNPVDLSLSLLYT